MSLESLIEGIWAEYSTTNPIVQQVHRLLNSEKEVIKNDHIAYRTVRFEHMGIIDIAKHFKKYGYVKKQDYQFPDKKLFAQYYQKDNSDFPKIFISELLVEKFSENIQNSIIQYIKKIPSHFFDDVSCMYAGAPWGKVSYVDYQKIIKESEYAAWLLVFGFRANHFTVNVNHLTTYSNLSQLNQFLKQNHIKLNEAGGEIKGSPQVFLEQSSTMANKILVEFLEGSYEIPCCYYEFAKRYAQPDGKLFHGFIANSANKIFESTDAKESQ